jgi:hypothetical protein
MDEKTDRIPKEKPPKGDGKGQCSCTADPFVSLPAELRPKSTMAKAGLRYVTCPNCGMKFWTNRLTDLCIKCEVKVERR